jgi:hypothetical protein
MGFIVKLLLLLVVVFRVVPAIVRLFLGRDTRPRPPQQPAPPPPTERSTLGGSEIVEAEFEDLPGGRS